MMKNQKKRLTQWLNDFISVATELKPNLNDQVIAGELTIWIPADIVNLLKRKEVVVQIGDNTFFECSHKSGTSFLKVVGTEPFTSLAVELH